MTSLEIKQLPFLSMVELLIWYLNTWIIALPAKVEVFNSLQGDSLILKDYEKAKIIFLCFSSNSNYVNVFNQRNSRNQEK